MQDLSARTNKLKTDFKTIVLSETQTTRVVLKAEKFPDSGLRLKLVHQKGSKIAGIKQWEDEDRFSKASLKKGEFVDFELNTEQTQKLLEVLPSLAALANIDLAQGYTEFLVLEGKEREVIKQLLEDNPTQFWELIEELNPGLINKTAILKEHKKRQAIVEIFEENLNNPSWDEKQWQTFFSENTWIFGHGLDYRILDPITGQPHYGGVSIMGTGQQRGDYLFSTRAEICFTVLVEIKKPQSLLVKNSEYRNGAHPPSEELIGGVSQLQVNCRTWTKASEQEQNRDALEEDDIFTCEPKGILIIGNTSQLDHRNKLNSFELFRRNINNPEIITFDELFERAKFVVSHHLSEQPKP